MKKEANENEEQDKQRRERVDKLNTADSLIFQTEKQLKEFGDKLPADKKEPIEQALSKLKEAHKSEDLEAIEKATAELTAVWQTASEEMYKASQAGAQASQEGGSSGGQDAGNAQGSNDKKDDDVTDVDFEEVK
jgi:molecular chaperone DnaK